MFSKNESNFERVTRLLIGLGLISWGYWISGTYWLGYELPTYQIPCWNWSNFVSHGCMVERGFIIAIIGFIPLITGMLGWCPLKSLFGLKV